MKKFFTLLMGLCLSFFITGQTLASEGAFAVQEGVTPISLSEAQKLLENNEATFFDVNTNEVRQNVGYIKGAILLEDSKKLHELLPKDKDAKLVFYCLNRMCYASSEMVLLTQELGYNNAVVMIDGIEGWVTSGRDVIKPHIKNWSEASKVEDFVDDIHSQLYFGEIPSCRDCHGTNGIRSDLANNLNVISLNCASCHSEVKGEFASSVHAKQNSMFVNNGLWDLEKAAIGEKLNTLPTKDRHQNEQGKDLPLCSSCHSVHIPQANKEAMLNPQKHLSDEKCGSCHTKEKERYHETFHGKAMFLNKAGSAPQVAACFDCHGKHSIYKVDDIRSTLSAANRIATCAECHPGSNQNFANFIAHADHTDKDNYPILYYAYVFMTGLVISVFVFFGLHTLLWSIRLIMFRIQHADMWKAAQHAAHSDKVTIKRFSTFHRIQHFFMAASFLGLAFSGLPQKFATAPWAQTMIDLMGGPIAATIIHHISAVIMFGVFFSHIGEIIYKAYPRRDAIHNPETGKMELKRLIPFLFGPESLMPRWQDFSDMKAHFLWFIGKGPRPQFDRWTYWEKFDYLAVFWGMFIIGFSGLMLWFPVAFSVVFPGWMLNLATLVHSDEALLATGFIFAIHFFNTHFRADRFPMDMVIFSGTITEEEMKQERAKWYERLKAQGKLDELKWTNEDFPKYKKWAKFVGFAMLITGMFFLFLMIYAFIDSLLG